MKFTLPLIGCLMTLSIATATPPKEQPPQYPGYELVWSDEFNVDGPPNPDNWSFAEGFIRNREDQWYQSDNAICKNGYLIIEARRERRPNPNYEPGSKSWKTNRSHIEYTSSILSTRRHHQWTFGRFEIRGKIDIGPGLWPAIWTLGTAREWPGCGEIDIMEYYRGKILANAAWAKAERWKGHWDAVAIPVEDLPNAKGWADRFHVWRMDWDEEAIKIYVDGYLLNTIELHKTINDTKDKANPFHEPHYLLLNLAIGGNNGGDPSRTRFPKRFVVDWVRVYQKTDDE